MRDSVGPHAWWRVNKSALIAEFPGADLANFATKSDVAELREEIEAVQRVVSRVL